MPLPAGPTIATCGGSCDAEGRAVEDRLAVLGDEAEVHGTQLARQLDRLRIGALQLLGAHAGRVELRHHLLELDLHVHQVW